MQACPPWPQIVGNGRIDLSIAADVITDAKAALATCDARNETLRLYIDRIVRPE